MPHRPEHDESKVADVVIGVDVGDGGGERVVAAAVLGADGEITNVAIIDGPLPEKSMVEELEPFDGPQPEA